MLDKEFILKDFLDSQNCMVIEAKIKKIQKIIKIDITTVIYMFTSRKEYSESPNTSCQK